MIALVDYGAGNLTSVRKAFAALDADIWTPRSPAELDRAGAAVVPGVGHFDATRGIDREWREALQALVNRGMPLLGICVGLQWLFEGSVEAPGVPGLGVFAGTCFHLGDSPPMPTAGGPPPARLKVPHVGWNSLTLPRASQLMAGVTPGTQVYFTHSYAPPLGDDTAAVCEYGQRFAAAAERGHVSGVQFHPEKSGEAGLQILRNWLRSAQ